MLKTLSQRAYALILLLLLSTGAMAQVDVVVVFGTVKDMNTAKKLDGVTITVFKNGSKLVEVPTNASGKYEVNLDYGAEYKVMCSKVGYVGKNINIDSRSVPEEDRQGGHGMNIDFTMMTDLPGVDFSILLEPFGKAKYVAASSSFEWDMEYINKMRDAQARLLKEYDDKKKREANAEADYAKVMAQGTGALAAADYKKAVDSFMEALKLKANDPIATAKLSDARMRLEAADADKNLNERYAALIKEADNLFGKKDYETAKAKYNAAGDVKDKEPYPKQKVREIDVILADLAKKAEEERKAKELQEKYQAAIAAADAAFKAENWDQATTKYGDASGLKPEEKYPKDQIALIATKKADAAKKAEEERKAKELNEKYQSAITAGDIAFKASNWEIATAKYTEAGGLKPEEKYPKDQLAAIALKKDEAAKKAEEERKAKELQEKYQAAIAAADVAFNGSKYDVATAKYTEASGLKPDEKYPKDQLALIQKKIDEERKLKDLDEQYKALLADAMQAFSGEKWDDAIAKYTEASALKPKEQYPKDQIAAIKAKKDELAKKAEEEKKLKELNEKYQAAITAADEAFGKEQWDAATTKYTEASGLKPTEKYPKDQLAAIVQRKAEAEAQKKQAEIDARYAKLIADADAAFGKHDFTAAKTKYQEASTVKPAERYPKDRIAEADARMAELAKKAEEERKAKELEAKYTELIKRADGSFDGNKLSSALVDYKEALGLKPNEAHPKARIETIESQLDSAAKAKAEEERLAREKRDLDKRYGDLIAAGDRDFTAKKYELARTSYSDAVGVKPAEKHPQDRLAEIERIIAEIARKADADKSAAEREAAERARKAEADRLAAELAAADKARLDEEARKKKAAEAEVESRYRDFVTAGDMAFGQDQFDKAREKFTAALGVKPAEDYPKQRLAAIDTELARRAKNQSEAERLADERRRADEERRRRELEEDERARIAANAERDRLEAERRDREARDAEAKRKAEERERLEREGSKAMDERYRAAILEADEAMASKKYQEARGMYAQASDLKPQETYPIAKIDQIDKVLAELERTRLEAELAAEKARLARSEPRPNQGSTIDPRKEQEAEQFMREAREREEAEKWERIRKLRADLDAEELAKMEDAANRRSNVMTDKQEVQEGRAGLYRGDESRRAMSAAEIQAYKDALAAAEAERARRAAENRTQSYEAKIALQDQYADQGRITAARQTEASNDAVRTTQRIQDNRDLRVERADMRTDAARQAVIDQQEQQLERERRAVLTAEDRVRAIEDQKRAQEARVSGYSQASELARARTKEDLDGTPTHQPRAFAEFNRNKLAGEYPPGVTEESYTEGNKVIIRRVVVRGNKADEYSKVIAKWGTYYFKNGQSITEAIWSMETEG